jgi:hypothetical protein
MPGEMTMSWLMLMGLGAFHGINPAMGWLFAVALGMQEGRRRAVIRALVPLAAGHALSVAVAVGAALAIGFAIPPAWLRWPIAGMLVSVGLLRFGRHRHPRWGGMRVSMAGLTVWSFLMATAHGAGLMVMPVFVAMSMSPAGAHAHHMHPAGGGAGDALLATGLHAAGYLAVTAVVAVVVFEKLGVGILRRAWINLDLIWSAALVATGMLTLLL